MKIKNTENTPFKVILPHIGVFPLKPGEELKTKKTKFVVISRPNYNNSIFIPNIKKFQKQKVTKDEHALLTKLKIINDNKLIYDSKNNFFLLPQQLPYKTSLI